MSVNAIIGTKETSQIKSVFTGHHGPVCKTKKVKADQGILNEGLIVALNADGLIVPYNPSAQDTTNDPVGVLLERCDTAKEDAANVIVHGTVWKDRIFVNEADLTSADIKKLENKGIFVMP